MRPGPVNLTAARAAPEVVVINFRERLEFFDDGALFDVPKGGVAPETARERGERLEKLEAPQHFERLLNRVLRPQVVAVPHHRVHEETPVSGKQCALAVGLYSRDQLAVDRVAVIQYVEAEQAQIAHQFAQMSISDKLFYAVYLQAFFWK